MCKVKLLTILFFLIMPLFLTSPTSHNINYQTETDPQGMGAETWVNTPIPADEYDFRAYYNGTTVTPSNENIVQVTRYYASSNEYICYLSWNLTDFRSKASLNFIEASLLLDYHSNDYWDTADDIDIKLKNLDTDLATPVATIPIVELTQIYESEANASLINIDVHYSTIALDVLPLIQYWYKNGTDNWITFELSPSDDNDITSGYETIKWEDSHHYTGTTDDPKLSISAGIVFPDALHDWSHRKKHSIHPASGAGTHYQVKFNVYYYAGEDTSGHVFLDCICQADFDDIRFTSNDGETELDFWIEKSYVGDNATIWVEITADLSSSTQFIYLYYGNPEVSTTSNGADTFLFFDDFNADNWNYSGTTVTINTTEGRMYWECISVDGYAYYDLGTTYEQFALETYGQRTNNAGLGNMHLGLVDTPTTYHNYSDAVIQHFQYDAINKQAARLYYGGTDNTVYGIPGEMIGVDYRWQLLYNKSHVTVQNLNLNQYANAIGSALTTLDNLLVCTRDREKNTGYFYWLLLRKYVYPEPTPGEWESPEENTNPGIPSQKMPEDYLRMEDTTDERLCYILDHSVSQSNGVTMEARARLVVDLVGTFGPMGFYVHDGTHMFIVSIGADFVKVEYADLRKFTWTDGGTFNASMWHTYRLTVKEGVLHVYIDGVSIGGPWTTQRIELDNHIRFGCLWSQTYQGIIDWDYIWIAQDEETAPPMIPIWDVVLDMSSSPSTLGWRAVVGKGNRISLPLGLNDVTAPNIENPPTNIILMEREAYWIEWDASDDHPAGYKIYRNNIVVEEAEVWDGSPVIYLIVGLTKGVYNYTIELYDEFGNSIIDTVLVTIEPASTSHTTTQYSTTSEPPTDSVRPTSEPPPPTI
ncbi:MAG: DUF2341 domain-containing protein, partial [Candidatus Hodarchaeota archaeon]